MARLTRHPSALLLFALGLVSCGTKQACFLPVLRTNETVRVMSVVGQSGSRRDSCPVAVPTKLAIRRGYGTVYLEWGVSSHFFVMRASSFDGQTPFEIGGVGVRPYSTIPPSTEHQGFTHIKMFPGNDFQSSPPTAESFSISVKHPDRTGEELDDEIQFQYDTVQCTCTLYDG